MPGAARRRGRLRSVLTRRRCSFVTALQTRPELAAYVAACPSHPPPARRLDRPGCSRVVPWRCGCCTTGRPPRPCRPRPLRVRPRSRRRRRRAVVVHVAGAVRRPGVYRLRAGARVVRRGRGARAARAAGADLSAVNLAAKLEDGRQVLVPQRAPAAPPRPRRPAPGTRRRRRPARRSTSTPRRSSSSTRSTASARRPRRRSSTTARQHGGFGSVEELGQVSGDRREAARRAARPGPGVSARRARRDAGSRGARSRTRCAAVAVHPRHRVLFALVAGLLLGPLAGRSRRGGGAGRRRRSPRRWRRRRPRRALGARPRSPCSSAAAVARRPARRARARACSPRLDGRPVGAARGRCSSRVRDRGFGTRGRRRVRLLDGPARRRAGRAAAARRAAPRRGGPSVGEISPCAAGRAARRASTLPAAARRAAALDGRRGAADRRAPRRAGRRARRGAAARGGGPRRAACAPPRRRCCAGWCSGRTSGSPTTCGPTSSAPGSRTSSRSAART